MIARSLQTALVSLALTVAVAVAPAAAAEPAPAPALSITSLATPTNFNPEKTGIQRYETRVNNIGGAATDGSPITITDTLPEGLSVAKTEFKVRYAHQIKDFGEDPTVCQNDAVSAPPAVTVKCTLPEELAGSGEESSVLAPAEELLLTVFVDLPVDASEGDVLVNEVEVEGGGASPAAATSSNEVSVKDAPPGFAQFDTALLGPDGQPVHEAGSHPYAFITSFSFNTKPALPTSQVEIIPSGGDPKDTPVALPPGLIGNPTATTRCTLQQFNTVQLYQPFLPDTAVQLQPNQCPDGSVVGYISLRRVDNAVTSNSLPIYSLVPPPGMPAQFGFSISGLPIFINTEVRPEENYKVVAVAHNISQAKRVIAASVTMWGNPADPRHDPIRGRCLNPALEYPNSIDDCPAGTASKPFLRLPTSCEDPLDITMSLDTWTAPGQYVSSLSSAPPPTGCDLLDFDPSLEARPTTNVSDSPTGLRVNLHIPQNEDPKGLGQADVRKVVVTLPTGMAINPSSAHGLTGCSPGQVGLLSDSPIRFSNSAAQCPEASKIGEVEVDTPLLDDPLHGGVYVAMPHDNPFDSLLAIYIAVDDPQRGIVVKLAGHVKADPRTGQLVTTFDENPQVPFEYFRLDFSGGPLAPLRTPPVCGAYSTTSVMTPWSAPESGPPATPSDDYSISKAPGGGACPTSEGALPHKPAVDAGTVSPMAGAYSPLVIDLRREDGSQEFSSVTVSPPPGLVGKLAGVPYCREDALQAAAQKTGTEEKASASCPPASEVGVANVAAGAGPTPYPTQGKVYLTGPYKGAPLSLAVITPATAGPYDLGTVVVRTALHVHPETTRITAVSDPIPHILEGIPLDVRSVSVQMSRPDFTLNPTDCDPMAFSGDLYSILGHGTALTERFQAAECSRLRFAPKLSLRLKGKTRRGGHPALRAVLKMPVGGANIARASVALPKSEFLDQSHIGTVCTRVQYAARQCPAASVYGFARAFSSLLDQPLEGPVYLRSSSNELPDLVAFLDGQIHVDVVGRIDSVKGGIRTTFEAVPDAPVEKFVLTMHGGRKGLLINSTNICKGKHVATAEFDGQNGKIRDFRPPMRAQCGKKRKSARHARVSGRPGAIG